MASDEYHVASFVVTCQPENANDVVASIDAMPGLEVHAEEQGKLVVTAEADDVRELADITAKLEAVRSVFSVAPVYHEYSTET